MKKFTLKKVHIAFWKAFSISLLKLESAKFKLKFLSINYLGPWAKNSLTFTLP